MTDTAKTYFASDLSAFFDTDIFAETITYNDVSISAVVNYGTENAGSESVSSWGTLMVKVSDVTSPSYRDTVVISGVTWKVYQDPDTSFIGDGYTWEIPIYRNERPVL